MRYPLLMVVLVAAGAAQAELSLEQKLGAQVTATAANGGWDGFDRVGESRIEPGLGASSEEIQAAEAARTIRVGAVVLWPKRALTDQLCPAWVVPLWDLGRKQGRAAIRRQLVIDLTATADKSGLSTEERGPIDTAALAFYDEARPVWAMGTLEAPLERLGVGVRSLKDHVLGLAGERRKAAQCYGYEAMARALVARVVNEALPPDKPSGG